MHGQSAIGGAGPLLGRAVPVEFHAVLVRIAKIQGFADTVIRGPVEMDASALKPPQGVGQGGPGGVTEGEMEETGRAAEGRLTALAIPRVQADVMVVASSADEGGLGAVALLEFQSQNTAVEIEGAIKVGDLEVDMADIDPGIDGSWCGHGLHYGGHAREQGRRE